MSGKLRVLVLCTGNSARSQMAEGILRHDCGDRFEVHSAGNRPSRVRPEAIQVMAEIGIDITAQRSKHVREFAGQRFDYVITVCDQAREACPTIPGVVQKLHWSIDDPAAVEGAVEGDQQRRLMAFRAARDELRKVLRAGVAPLAPPAKPARKGRGRADP
ncbi:MAG TPA: arsenate reductase ArsC [Terriglobales bacterium]|nr:arsenate reductase ArsC [Terriglobales bacterium]